MCTITAVTMTRTSQTNQQGAGQVWQQSRVTALDLLIHKPYIQPHKLKLFTSSSLDYVLPINYFFTLSPYEMLFFRGQDAQGVFLASPGLSIDYIRALIHVNCALW